ncbi:fatty acid hydroxylase family protein [Leptospira fainei serovar Hurstbridge str. BUT 6]|uniref:Fatty acid hydroxylase family protein n=1 Tax=Leptospira fainei serovar Hurstbridge str. BUT 6 TaxID=1193011 RepID=S3V2P4_9LEPT|nr:sterol desaturase family protein [Leptospira fainei]EPG75698.1 fatty acid hydroxylase family protein [Leptospira fainei serovar Hurstbridge str. BUT 6]
MGESIIDLAVPFFLILILVEAYIGRKKNVYRWNDTITDLGTGILFSLTGVFVTLGSLWIYEQVRVHFSIQHLWGFSELPVGSPIIRGVDGWEFRWAETISWLLILLAVDFIYYWFHRATHEVHFLWACHVTHHSSEEFNLSVALRQSSFQRIFEYAFNLPLAIAGVPWWSLLLCQGILKIYQFWVHTRLIGKLGWVEQIFLTPSHHRVHHGRDPKYLDKNHGGILILWDKWFGTYAEETSEPVYGLTTQLGTFNPLTANLHIYRDLWNLIRLAPNWKDKFLLLVQKPDWRPSSLGGTKEIPPISRELLQVYDPQISRERKVYAIAQFFILAILTLSALRFFKKGILGIEIFLLASLWITFSFYTIGILLEGRKKAIVWESIRLASLPILVGYAWIKFGI